jgi:HK97 family phage portal protein
MLLWGNAYIEIERSLGFVIGLKFLHPARMTARRRPDGTIGYWYIDYVGASEPREILEANLMHIPAFSTDGITGISPILYGANVFGTAIETDRASAETFRDTMRVPGVMTMDVVLKPEQREQIRQHVKDVSENGGVMVLEKGASFQNLGFDPKSAEMLASRSFNVEEIARWFRVDPAMIGHGGKDSNWGTGLEQKMLWFLTFTLRHWCVRIEQAVRKNLLTPAERKLFFPEYNMEALLRSDSAGRAAYFTVMADHGILTRDEIRALDNWKPMGGNAGVLTVQSAMIDIDDMNKGTNSSAISQPALAAEVVKALKDTMPS